MKVLQLTGADIRLDILWSIAEGEVTLELAKAAREAMLESRKYIEGRLSAGEVMYGVNTGFGAFSSVRISDSEIEELQVNLIRSHSMGVDAPFSKNQTRAIMALRANALCRGHSGIRPEVVDKILEFLNQDIIPVIPQKGSVGASGDLAPLSHLALALIGEGEVWGYSSAKVYERISTAKILQQKQVKPLVLKAKEGLSLINGCQVMTAVGSLAMYQAGHLLKLADISGACSLEGLRGSRSAFDPLIFTTRPHPGEAKTARNLLRILGATSTIAESHEDCNKVQDAYSLRCMPAVHGATKDTWSYVRSVLETEANSSTDNPLVFAKENKVLSCGNFHGMPVAFAMDFAAIAFTSLASISECRIEKLVNPTMSDLPAFLTPQGGLNSGHMIVQVAAASLVSENKIYSHPASVDSIPTSADKEDHVSMGTIAARKFTQILNNAQNVVAMEFLSAMQAFDLLKPLKPAGGVAVAYEVIRSQVPFATKDRVFSTDIEKIRQMIDSGKILKGVESKIGDLET
jgi:histidine ammonia-lyase